MPDHSFPYARATISFSSHADQQDYRLLLAKSRVTIFQVSGDSDFATPLDLIRQDLRRQVMVLNPKDRRSDLIHHATIYKDIPRDLPLRCQLPDIIPVGSHGNTIHRPPGRKALRLNVDLVFITASQHSQIPVTY